MPLHRQIIGIRISGNKVGHIQTRITLFISIEKIQICAEIEALNMYFLKHLGRVRKFLTIQMLLSKRSPKVTFEHIF